MSYPGVNLLFADDFDHFRHRLGHPLIPFGLGHEEGVEHGDALAEHCDLQLLFFLEVIHELLQSHLLVTSRLHCVQLEPDEETLELCKKNFSGDEALPIPQGPLCVVILFLGSQDWL